VTDAAGEVMRRGVVQIGLNELSREPDLLERLKDLKPD